MRRVSTDSKKEQYDLSQKFMLMTRYITLFTKVIWAHPEAKTCADVPRCRQKAIEFLSTIPPLRLRMHAIWEKAQWTGVTSSSPDKQAHNAGPNAPKYPALDSTFPSAPVSPRRASVETSKYPSFEDGSGSPRRNSVTEISHPSAKRHCSVDTGVSIPFDLPATFSDIAKSNTAKGIETCGVLLGYNQDNSSFLITTVVIPQQTGTRDTCEALDGAEEKILTYALSNDLVCLGWIHTHPTQSCFLSSVDMHTTLSYQQMLPNAVAIVVAPTDRNLPVGVWRLTDSGMNRIRACNLRGFHIHDGKEAYSQLVRDVSWDTSMNVVVVDLRHFHS